MSETSLSNKKIAILATDYFEERELTSPMGALEACGATVEVVAPHAGQIKALNHIYPGRSIDVDKTLDQADPASYDGVIVPGGAINADYLRMDQKARQFIKNFAKSRKLTAVI